MAEKSTTTTSSLQGSTSWRSTAQQQIRVLSLEDGQHEEHVLYRLQKGTLNQHSEPPICSHYTLNHFRVHLQGGNFNFVSDRPFWVKESVCT